MQRTLLIDGIPQGWSLVNPVIVQDRETIEEIYADYYALSEPPALTLDCRSLRTGMFNMLLKFMEEFKGTLTVIANEPIPEPVMSRFSMVHKSYQPREGLLLEMKLREMSPIMREKINALFGLKTEEG